MLQRTLRHKDNLDHFIDQLIEHTEALERANEIRPTSRKIETLQERCSQTGDDAWNARYTDYSQNELWHSSAPKEDQSCHVR